MAALATFALIASLDEPTPLDWAVYEWAHRAYRRSIALAQAPLELAGLPGAYIPLTVLAARRLRRRGHRGGPTIVSGAIAGWLTVRLMRLLVWRPRPPEPPRRRNDTESSFPSGHTTGVTTLTAVATRVLRDEQILTPLQATAIRVGVPLVFALHRVYVQEHWLTDVLGGLALGTAVGEAVLTLV
jgi:undecaprenyl-diphosphatase